MGICSDKVTFIGIDFVGSSLGFRHFLIYWILRWSKFTGLWTPSCFFNFTLSKVHSTSDTSLSFWNCGVRRLFNFGHHSIFLVLPCPKVIQLQTPRYRFGIAVSEGHPTSDTASNLWY